jgi:hypothetical protein
MRVRVRKRARGIKRAREGKKADHNNSGRRMAWVTKRVLQVKSGLRGANGPRTPENFGDDHVCTGKHCNSKRKDLRLVESTKKSHPTEHEMRNYYVKLL